MKQWLERGALPMSLSFGKALHPQMEHLTQVKMSAW